MRELQRSCRQGCRCKRPEGNRRYPSARARATCRAPDTKGRVASLSNHHLGFLPADVVPFNVLLVPVVPSDRVHSEHKYILFLARVKRYYGEQTSRIRGWSRMNPTLTANPFSGRRDRLLQRPDLFPPNSRLIPGNPGRPGPVACRRQPDRHGRAKRPRQGRLQPETRQPRCPQSFRQRRQPAADHGRFPPMDPAGTSGG